MISKTQTQAEVGTVESPSGQQGAEGKEASSGDAVTYGLQAYQLLLPEEDKADYEEFGKELWASLAPNNMQEANLAARIINLSWRLQRAGRYEQYVVEATKKGRAKSVQVTDGEAIADLLMQTQTYGRMSHNEAHLERWLHRNLAAFRQLQKERKEEEARRAQLASGQQAGSAA